MSYLPFLLLYTWFAIYIHGFSSTPNPLNGQHLRVIWVKKNKYLFISFYNNIQYVFKKKFFMQTLWSGNPKGLIGPLKGAVLLECMSKRFNFT
jgi:hypothetical protein